MEASSSSSFPSSSDEENLFKQCQEIFKSLDEIDQYQRELAEEGILLKSTDAKLASWKSEIQKGQRFVFCGQSGSLKSTTINWMLRSFLQVPKTTTTTTGVKNEGSYVHSDQYPLYRDSENEEILKTLSKYSRKSKNKSSIEPGFLSGYLLPEGSAGSTTQVKYEIEASQSGNIQIEINYISPKTVYESIEKLIEEIKRKDEMEDDDEDEIDEDEEVHIHAAKRMLGMNPMDDITLDDLIIEKRFYDRIGQKLIYTIDSGDFEQDRKKACELLQKETAHPSSCLGMIEKVIIKFPHCGLLRYGGKIVDVPGAEEVDSHNTQILQDSISDADVLIMMLSSSPFGKRSILWDSLVKSDFVEHVVKKNSEKQLWVIVPGDKWFSPDALKQKESRKQNEEKVSINHMNSLKRLFKQQEFLDGGRFRFLITYRKLFEENEMNAEESRFEELCGLFMKIIQKVVKGNIQIIAKKGKQKGELIKTKIQKNLEKLTKDEKHYLSVVVKNQKSLSTQIETWFQEVQQSPKWLKKLQDALKQRLLECDKAKLEQQLKESLNIMQLKRDHTLIDNILSEKNFKKKITFPAVHYRPQVKSMIDILVVFICITFYSRKDIVAEPLCFSMQYLFDILQEEMIEEYAQQLLIKISLLFFPQNRNNNNRQIANVFFEELSLEIKNLLRSQLDIVNLYGKFEARCIILDGTHFVFKKYVPIKRSLEKLKALKQENDVVVQQIVDIMTKNIERFTKSRISRLQDQVKKKIVSQFKQMKEVLTRSGEVPYLYGTHLLKKYFKVTICQMDLMKFLGSDELLKTENLKILEDLKRVQKEIEQRATTKPQIYSKDIQRNVFEVIIDLSKQYRREPSLSPETNQDILQKLIEKKYPNDVLRVLSDQWGPTPEDFDRAKKTLKIHGHFRSCHVCGSQIRAPGGYKVCSNIFEHDRFGNMQCKKVVCSTCISKKGKSKGGFIDDVTQEGWICPVCANECKCGRHEERKLRKRVKPENNNSKKRTISVKFEEKTIQKKLKK